MKRLLISMTLVSLVSTLGHAQKEPCAIPGENNAYLGIQTIRLWPGDREIGVEIPLLNFSQQTIFQTTRDASRYSAESLL